MKSSTWLLSSAAAAIATTAVVVNLASCSAERSTPGEGGTPPGSDAGGADGASHNPESGTSPEAEAGPATDAAADASMGMLPFSADTPSTYVAKVKNLLVALPPTDQEVQTVQNDPTQLATLVDTWMTSTAQCAPSQNPADTCVALYQKKMLRFFELAFQQTQVVAEDFSNMLEPGQLQLDLNKTTEPLMVQNHQEVFARTMLALDSNGQPFTQAMTTQSYMLTTAMKVFYALTDVWQLDNDVQGIQDAFATAHPGLTIQVTAKPVALSDTLNPASANYMIWSDPTLTGPCDPLVYQARANLLYDVLNGVYVKDKNGCDKDVGQGQLTAADFGNWTMTTISQPQGGQTPTKFYDLVTLRDTTQTQMVLNRPYVSYFTTPAFFANWQTNASNQMRVTMNQTLIVATGTPISPNDPTVPSIQPPPGLDQGHASNAACVGCHQHLDPTRSILSSTFSWYYGEQINLPAKDNLDGGPLWSQEPGIFVFEGVNASPKSVYDLGTILAQHPMMAAGWVQKLCYYLDSEACDPSDPAFTSLVTGFQSGYSWDALVKAVVTSPITTHTTTTLTATTNGEPVAVSRRDHLCAAINARLGFADVCNLDATKVAALPASAEAIVPGLPSDGYGRGAAAPVLPNNPTLFYRAGLENFCEGIAAVVIDNKNPPAGVTTWQSSACSDTTCQPITDFVNLVAGIPPSDPRATPLYQALLTNFDMSKAQAGTTATAALQSTFTAACMAPSALSIGL
jgi:hypothetical protein